MFWSIRDLTASSDWFGITSLLTREQPAAAPEKLEGVLAHLSPERPDEQGCQMSGMEWTMEWRNGMDWPEWNGMDLIKWPTPVPEFPLRGTDISGSAFQIPL